MIGNLNSNIPTVGFSPVENATAPTKLEPVRGAFNLHNIGAFFDDLMGPEKGAGDQKDKAPAPDLTFGQQLSGSLIIIGLVAAFFFLRR